VLVYNVQDGLNLQALTVPFWRFAMRSIKRLLWFTCVVFGLSPLEVHAELKLPAVLSSHMVLQRDLPVPIWGQATAGENVLVKFRDKEKTVTADKTGKWLIKLDPLKAGGPDRLVIRATDTLTLDDVLVGEVWVGSGQSNMEGSADSYRRKDEVLARAVAAAPYPLVRLKHSGSKGWQEATPANVKGFSALLFSFGLRLHKELDVPVGLMLGALGGTPSARWLSEEAYKADPACKEAVKRFAPTYPQEKLQKEYEEELARWKKEAEAARKEGKMVPKKPLAPKKPGEANGKIGSQYESHIRPFIPFAIRGVLWDQGENGTAIVGIDQYTLMGALLAGWRKDWGQGDFPFIYIQKPSGGGCAYDRDSPITNQADKFTNLPASVPPTTSGFYRDNHLRILNYPHTGMAISSDLGPGLHPVNKSGYGERAARVALGMVYGQKVEYYGPTYKSHETEGNKVRITFTHLGQGLEFRHGDKLQGFAVAGEDKVFHWAQATIEGDTVVLTCDRVARPVAVRYAWADKHPWANLFNKDTLPALPFRTDDW